MTYTLPLEQVSARDLNLVGGKGANLGEMLKAAFPVPDGFCVTTAAYKKIIAEGDLYPQIERLLDASEPLADIAAKIRKMIRESPIPADLAGDICAAYARLGNNVSVAVRSSATAEDLPSASFAGQQETYLGIRGDAEVLRCVQLCWASLWTERAISYRQKNGFPHNQVALAVVVQEMVAPQTAGVLFTVNPLNGKRDEMLVNASYGLGESVVSGQVTPDTCRISPSGKVIEANIGAKETRIDWQPEGGTRAAPVPPEERERLCLNPSQLKQLAKLGVRVQKHYGAPQDIEWAFAGEKLYLLQTRPITSLRAAPRKLSSLEHRILDDILEHYPDPPYPLDYFAVTEGYEQVQNAVREAGMHAVRADEIIRMDGEGIPYVEAVAPRPSWKSLALPVWVARKMRIDPETWMKAESGRFAARIAALDNAPLEDMADDALADFIAQAVGIATEIGTLRFSRYIIPMMLRGALLIAWVKWVTGDKDLIEADLLGDLDYRTARIDRALKALAREAEKDAAVGAILLDSPPDEVMGKLEKTPAGRAFLEKVEDFLAEHGARTMKVYLPFSNASWREKPENLMAVLPLMMRAGEGESGGRFSALRAKMLEKLPKFLHAAFLRMLENYRNGHIAREATLYAIEEAFFLARRGTQVAARRLLAAGYLAGEEEILFLTLPELYAALRGEKDKTAIRALIAQRKNARPKAHAVWQARGEGKMPLSENMIRGQAGSPGRASGPVKVITGPAEFHKLARGDVLVCPFTDPTWTPLFGLAAAVVADTGGSLSHAAIVAREYGIPAVLGTQVATSTLQDGMTVTVDGGEGVVVME